MSTIARRKPLLISNMYVGIDPGATGGITCINEYANMTNDLWICKMPSSEVDMINHFREIVAVTGHGNVRAFVEKVGGYIKGSEGQPGNAMFNFGWKYGSVRMACLAAGIPLEEVMPNVWQKAHGIPPKKNTEKKTQWKNRLRSHAQRLFPDYKIIIQVADSVLIAEYGRRKMNGILLPTVSGGKEKKGVADGD